MICCALDRPDPKVVPLHFLAGTCRDAGAASVGLVAPYLAYMRQDKPFRPGETVAAKRFAGLVSTAFDWLVTVDPHLHRIRDLSDIYDIPAKAVHASSAIARWIEHNVRKPVLVGPDEESEQWVSAVAAEAQAPWIVLQKVRRSDRDVEVSVPEVSRWRKHVPVLVDDIISTAGTMVETAEHLAAAGMQAPVCIGVHAVFAGDAYARLSAVAGQVVTCNTIDHASNGIDIASPIAEAVRQLMGA